VPPLLTRSQSRKLMNSKEARTDDSKVEEIMPRVFAHITNTESTCTMHQEVEAMYLADHLYQDWRLLSENLSSHSEGVAMGMHNLLQIMQKKSPDLPVRKKNKSEHWWDKQRDSEQVDSTAEWTRLPSLRRRAQWEETLDEKYLLPFIAKFEETLLSLHKKWNNKEDECGPFVSELRETSDVSAFPLERRREEMPQVLAYRAPVTLMEVQRRLPQAKKEHDLTVLSTVLQTHIWETMGALRTLVGQFQWHSLVHQRFSGRITRQDAQETTVGEAIAGELRVERLSWEHAYRKLESAWTDAFQYVDRFECLEIPDALKTVYLSKDSKLECAIADEKDMGICPLVLTQWLVARHNDLVQAAAIVGGYPIRKVSSKTMGHHDVILYDKEVMMRFIRDRCVTHGAGGRLNLDLVELERQLRHEFARPELAFELRLFQWLGETSGGTNSLMALIQQRDLSPEVEGRLRNEIRTPVQAAACMQKLQMAATFIVNSKDSLETDTIGGMKLADYLAQVLAEPPDSIPSATARAEVCLHHVDAFARLIKSVIHHDPMDLLPFKFKVQLDAALEAKVAKAAAEIQDQVESTIKAMEALVDTLESKPPDAEQTLTEWLGTYVDLIFSDSNCAAAITRAFPAELKLKHWDSTYRILRKAPAAASAPGS